MARTLMDAIFSGKMITEDLLEQLLLVLVKDAAVSTSRLGVG